jgi:tetratricopeptide (TPR) repeat protein
MQLERYWQQIEQSFERGNADAALSMLEELLARFPSHLEGLCLLAEILKQKGQHADAQRCLAAVQAIDPENELLPAETKALPAPKSRTFFLRRSSTASETHTSVSSQACQENVEKGMHAIGIGRHREASRFFQMAVAASPENPVAQLGLLESLWRSGSWQAARTQALAMLSTHPLWVKARLILADLALDQGNDAEAAVWMHEAQSLDPSFIVARRLLHHSEFESSFMNLSRRQNIDESFTAEKPAEKQKNLPAPVPALPVGPEESETIADDESNDAEPELGEKFDLEEELEKVLKDLESIIVGDDEDEDEDAGEEDDEDEDDGENEDEEVLAVKRHAPHAIDTDVETELPLQFIVAPEGTLETDAAGQSASSQAEETEQEGEPAIAASTEEQKAISEAVMVLVINRLRLRAKYGRENWRKIEKALEEYVHALKAEGGYTVMPVYFDNSMTVADNGLAAREVASQVRMIFQSISISRGEDYPALYYVLIVGGDDIIPAFRLPNMTGDADTAVVSDNPYGTDDENWLTPKWAVGRLPSANDDGTYLLNRIKDATLMHRQHTAPRGLRSLLHRLQKRKAAEEPTSFGLAASIWRRSSRAVFKTIGNPFDLRLSPPVSHKEFIWGNSAPYTYQYYCLHGLTDSNYWYGQRDPSMPADYAQFPVTLTPDLIPSSPTHQSIIFTSACYGLSIEDGSVEGNLSRSFMSRQAIGVVGSTGIAYGGLEPPLVGADRLAAEFWRCIQRGFPVGIALQQAKLQFAAATITAQEYLDWEDQKTLTSFMLLGDPSIRPPLSPKAQSLTLSELKEAFAGPLEQQIINQAEEVEFSELALKRIQEVVVGQVPVMEGSSVKVAQQVVNAGTLVSHAPGETEEEMKQRQKVRFIVTLKQELNINDNGKGQQWVRVTTNDTGSILKITASH